MKNFKFFTIWRLFTGLWRRFIEWRNRRQLKKRYNWLLIQYFTPIAKERSKCCDAMVWRGEKDSKKRWFCDKCTNRLLNDFSLYQYSISINEIDKILREVLVDYASKMKGLTRKNPRYPSIIALFEHYLWK